MTIHTPQVIWLALTVMGLGFSLAKHGESKTGEENFFVTLIVSVLVFGLLYWGGFFG